MAEREEKRTISIEINEFSDVLREKDRQNIAQLEEVYQEAGDLFKEWDSETRPLLKKQQPVTEIFDRMGKMMQNMIASDPNIAVYPFSVSPMNQSEASRLIYKLRDVRTGANEFIYYTQRAYELLFQFAFANETAKRKYWMVKTPVTHPYQNYAVHKIPSMTGELENTVMCVMLRAALLPSMILAKEIEEYANSDYSPPFALFKISRDDDRDFNNMRYTLDLERSFFDLEKLHGKDLVFADPMNATGGSLITIIHYLTEKGIKPKSIKVFNVISALPGLLRIVRTYPFVKCYTLWLDPVLNDKAYILPGLGDAGDRLNGVDDENPRNILRLISHYGSHLNELYSSQIRMMEEVIFESTAKREI